MKFQIVKWSHQELGCLGRSASRRSMHGFLLFYTQRMRDIVDFKGGLYAVTTDIDQQTDIDAMDRELHEFLIKNGFEKDEGRPRMGNIITPDSAYEVLRYQQMDYYMPVKEKMERE